MFLLKTYGIILIIFTHHYIFYNHLLNLKFCVLEISPFKIMKLQRGSTVTLIDTI